MGGPKKKSSKGKAPSKQPKQQPKAPAQAFLEQQQLLSPLDRMASVRPLWQSLTPEEREAALTVPLDDLRAYAKEQAARNRLASEAEMVEAAAAGQIILSFDPALDEVLDQGLARSKESGTWKVWHWPPDKAEFKDTDAFKNYLEEHLLGPEHLAVLPKDPEGSRPLEKPSEAAFRKRMQDLLLSVQEQRQAQDEEVAMASRRQGARRQLDPLVVMRDATIELIITILSALEREHDSIYQHCLFPVTSFICDVLPEGSFKTSRTELYPEDLESLLPDDIQRIFEFLQEKLDTLSTRLKPDAAELEQEDPNEEPIGDVDLFALTPDGNALCVNDKWMSHLRSRVLGEDSQPRQAKDGEDPTKAGLALEWVYGTIVSTAEKGRDAAHRTIGTKPVSPEEAVEALVNALEEQAMWEQHARSSRELLSQMLTSRKEAAAMGQKYDLRTTTAANGGVSKAVAATSNAAATVSVPNGETSAAAEGAAESTTTTAAAATAPTPELPNLPPNAILFLLKREALLTAAKLHGLKLEQVTAKRELRSYQAQLRAGEPRFERLRRELDDMKSAPSRSLDGTYRNTSEMERHRSQLADAAIEDQITAQAEFRKIGSRLQNIVDMKTEIEIQISRRDQEAHQLQLWRRNVCQMVDSLEDNIAAAAPLESLLLADGAAEEVDEEAGEIDDAKRALIAAVKAATHHAEELETLQNNFNTTFRKELYVPADDIAIFETVQKQLKETERRLEDGRVAVQHLLQFAINVACDDPGIAIGQNIVLPYLQEKLDLKGLDWANEKAAAAQDEVIRMELLLEDKQRQEKEKKAKAKAKAKEKARSEKERERADREAREREAREAEEEAKRQAEAAAEEARRKKVAELEALRLAEEELMERRRKELLADEDSHWSQRSQQRDELRNAQAEIEQQIVQEASSTDRNNNNIAAVGASSASAPGGAGKDKGKDDGFIAAGASNGSKRSANRGRGKESKEKGVENQQQDKEQQRFKPKDANSNKTNGGAMPNGRGKQQHEPAGNVSSSSIADTTTATLSSEPATSTAVPAIIVSPPNGVAAAGAAASSSSPLAPSSPDRVESAQPAPAVSSAIPCAPLSPEQQHRHQQQHQSQSQMLPPAAGMPLPPPPPNTLPTGPAMMAMPLPPPGMVPVPASVPVAVSVPLPLPGTVVGLPPVPGIVAVPPPVVAAGALAPQPHSRSGSGFSGAGGEELNSPMALPHGLPPPPPPPPRRNQPQHLQQQQQQLPLPPAHFPGGPPPPLPVVGAGGPYTGPPPPHHPNMYYPSADGEPPLPPHMLRPSGPHHAHPPMGYAMPLPQHHNGGLNGPPMGPIPSGGSPVPIPPPPPPPRPASSTSSSALAPAPHHQGAAGVMHPAVHQYQHHPYHMQHGGMLQPPPGVAMGQPMIHGNGRPYPQHQQQQQQQFGPYHPAVAARYNSGSGGASTRQLRAAAQPFVPSSNSFSMQESGAAGAAAGEGNSESIAAPPPGSNPSTKQHHGIDAEEASPRGILEPAELAAAAAAAAKSNEPGLITTSHGTAPSTAGDEAASEASSRTAGSFMSDAGPVNGAFEAGQQEQMLALVGNGSGNVRTAGQTQAVAAGAAAGQPSSVPPPVVDLKKLKSVRGLSNSPGVYNCFLNVIIQSLWHLPAFRKALLSLTPSEMQKHTAADKNNTAQVLTSLRAIFEELNSSTSATAEDDDTLPLQPVSPQQLREALGGSRFDHGNMHDAAEVLGELFDRLHVAEVGPHGRDPTLPRTVRVDAASVAPKNSTSGKKAQDQNGQNGGGTDSVPAVVAKGSVWGNAAALKMVKRTLALADAESSAGGSNSGGGGAGSAEKRKEPVSMVQKLFGMEVQAPLHNSNSSNGSSSNNGVKGKSKNGNRSSSSSSHGAAATVEVLQFTRYFHLVPAHGLRNAAATASASSFEDALVAATGGGKTPPTERLLTKPAVFTLSTVFESPQVPAAALAATLSALRPELDISRLFLDVPNKEDHEEVEDGAASDFKYRLRCMVCYSSSHYFAFAYSEEVGQWLLLDDARVSAVGHWKDVQAAAAQRRLQPSLLFYESISAA